jgi:hypothetical protein
MGTWGPLRLPSNKLELMREKDLSPLLSDGGGLAFGDSFALAWTYPGWVLSPELSDGAGTVRMGSKEAVEPLRRPCSWTTPPYPQSRPISLLATLWVGSRSSVYGHAAEPGAMYQEGDKSGEAVP